MVKVKDVVAGRKKMLCDTNINSRQNLEQISRKNLISLWHGIPKHLHRRECVCPYLNGPKEAQDDIATYKLREIAREAKT